MNNSCVEKYLAKNLEMWIIFRILVGWVGGEINRENVKASMQALDGALSGTKLF